MRRHAGHAASGGRTIRFIVVAVVVTLLPVARADSSVDAGVAFVTVDDQRGGACHNPLPVDGCFADYDSNGTASAGDDEINAYANVESLRVGARPARVPLLGGGLSSLVPDNGLLLDLREMRVDHPVIVTYEAAHEAVESRTGDLPVDVDSNESGYVIRRPEPFWDLHSRWDEGEDPWLGRTHAGAPGGVVVGSSDEVVQTLADCRVHTLHGVGPVTPPVNPRDACHEMDWPTAAESLLGYVPVVVYGAEWNNVAFSPDDDGGATTPLSGSQASAPSLVVGGGATLHQPNFSPESGTTEPLAIATSDDVDASGRTAGATSRTQTVGAVRPAWTDATVPALAAAVALAAGVVLAVALALYQRLMTRDLPHHPSRARILAVVRARPGISMTELGREVGMDRKGAEYHVRLLARHRFLVLHGRPGAALVFPPEAAPPRQLTPELSQVVWHDIARRVLAVVHESPGMRRAAITRAVGAKRQTVEWHVARLLAAGFLDEDERGNLACARDGGDAILAAAVTRIGPRASR